MEERWLKTESPRVESLSSPFLFEGAHSMMRLCNDSSVSSDPRVNSVGWMA